MPTNEMVPPGSVIGILGDGQLGRMLIQFGIAKLGYRAAVLGPGGRESAAGQIAYWAEAWGKNGEVSEEQLDRLCKIVKLVLIEWESIPLDLVRRIEARGIPVRSRSMVLEIAQDRLHEKNMANRLRISTTSFINIETAGDVRLAGALLPGILKTRRDGFDGRSQIRIKTGDSVEDAWEILKKVPCIFERVVDFVGEVSVIVAGSSHAGYVTYEPLENIHENGILRTTYSPPNSQLLLEKQDRYEREAMAAALKIAEHLDIHGILAVEFFVREDGKVLFNEMAPRPHNPGHLTIECFDISQFEAYVRAACNLPLRQPKNLIPGMMRNLIGGEVNGWIDHLPDSGRAVHIYGKGEARPLRKMGHVTYRNYWDTE